MMRRRANYRELIRGLLRAAPGPLSAEDLRAALEETGIGIATVYRHLKEGLGDGDFVCVELPGGPKRFEPADRPPHHYFQCVECHTVLDIEGCPDGLDRLVPQGFEIERHEVILTGRCRSCASPDREISAL